jgi:hypothetical protein
VGQGLELRGLGIAVQRPGGGQRQGFAADAEAGEVAGAEVFGQRVARGALVEMPVRQVLHHGARFRQVAALPSGSSSSAGRRRSKWAAGRPHWFPAGAGRHWRD